MMMKFPPLEAILSDGAGSGTLVYGPAIQDWKNKDIGNNEGDFILQWSF